MEASKAGAAVNRSEVLEGIETGADDENEEYEEEEELEEEPKVSFWSLYGCGG